LNEEKPVKRFHVNIAVKNLDQSRNFYSRLFDKEPSVTKVDYAKWMLDDPRLNFSITASAEKRGIRHLGLQTDSIEEVAEIQHRLERGGEAIVEQPQTECCYARSSKTWAQDPDDVSWEVFVTHEQIERFGSVSISAEEGQTAGKRCCA
jgi:predicted lactoylglutathione lyase